MASSAQPPAVAASPPPSQRPIILIVSHALTGHLSPMLRISAGLRALGWTVYFLGPTAHEPRIRGTGAAFLPLAGAADLDDRAYYARPPVPGYRALHWAERVLVDLRAQCLEPLPEAWSCVRAALRAVRADDAGREVVVLAEAFFYGILPLHYGAPLPGDESAPQQRPKTLCVSVTVPAIRSPDLPPCGYPFPFDPSAAGRERNARLWRSWARKAAPLTALLRQKLREAGATRELPDGSVFLSGENYTCHSRILQLGVPGFEYPRASWPAGFRFAGLVQGEGKKKKNRNDDADGPGTTAGESRMGGEEKQPDFPWWPDVLANSGSLRPDPSSRKKIVVVAQGTVETNPHDLIVPTIRAFANSPEILVVAILGWKNATLTSLSPSLSASSSNPNPNPSPSNNDDDDDNSIPPNAYIADYLAYDAALAHADAWVHNGGFGAVSHGIAHGVPMVVAGEGMDKTENAARVAWSGIGVDLGCARPTAEAVREGVERVLGGGGEADGRAAASPRQRVEELRRESEAIDCLRVIHEELLSLAGNSGS
ncbi:hypothetical protein F5X99DRAFT_359585 [Biscogniauxia marginata]|nr:hypothetical protein F5X99DRAFT_359585 [Biscogniauxia marginata]